MRIFLLSSVLLLVGMPARADPPAYDALRNQLAHQRSELAAALRAARGDERRAVLRRARAVLLDALTERLMPAWFGTPWDFNGTTEIPGTGSIACGYFVSTLLRDAGFGVERVRLARQAAEHIIQSLVGEPQIRRFRDKSSPEVLEAVRDLGEGLYLVGLDNHVGFLVVDDEQVRFCHASFVTPTQVVCEAARDAVAFESRYRVVGRLLDDRMLEAWLTGRPFATRVR